MQQLPINTLLQGGKYKIEKVLGQGGFGITYLATQELLDRKVCIKEFFFKEYCERDEETSHVSLGTQSNHELVERFMNKFLKEARTISQLDHRNIIKIHDIFKENNTSYYVMDYVEGESLNDMVSRRGALPEKEAVAYIERVGDALKYIHQHNINHLDIKPSNIMIRQGDYRVVLIDFGLSKQYDVQGGQTSTTPVGISHGYAPMEQYKQGGVCTFSPQTDIYALGATLYKLVTGNTPPQASDILNDGLPELPSSISLSTAETIKKAMQPRKVDRPNSIDEFISGLKTFSQNRSFVHQEIVSQQNQNSDEETKVLSNTNVETEAKRERNIGTSQPKIILDSDKKTYEQTKQSGNKVVIVLLILLGCFSLFFLLKDCNNSTKIAGPSSGELYKQAVSYLENSEYNKAFPLLIQAAEDSLSSAWYSLGWCYENGAGVTKDIEKAKEWYLKAANGGVIDAFDNLGLLNYEQKQYDVAFNFWKAGAEKEQANAQFNLGICYYNGKGTNKNLTEAGYWWRKSALQGHVKAQLSLGFSYYNGEGTKKDKKEAFKWWLKSAEQGDSEGQYYIAICYYNGEGVTKDLRLSKEWLEKSAAQGNEEAKKFLIENDFEVKKEYKNNSSQVKETKEQKVSNNEKHKKEQSSNNEYSNEVFQVVEEMPEFPGGMVECMKFLGRNIQYPKISQENGIQGRVIVTFVINKDGSITEAKIARSVDYYLDKEALRVVSLMPKWKPGKINGKAVRVKYTLPVMFRLE